MSTEIILQKACLSCKESKPFTEFSSHSQAKDKKQPQCKECRTHVSSRYIRTKKGLISRIYNGQCLRSKTKDYPCPDYSLNELREWAFNQPIFHELHDKWVKSGYEKMLVPSFDRTDDYKGYSLDRLQIMTWAENNAKGYEDRKNGTNNKSCKGVKQISKSGEIIAEFHSQRYAERITGISSCSISLCCNKRKMFAGGFIWRYI